MYTDKAQICSDAALLLNTNTADLSWIINTVVFTVVFIPLFRMLLASI